MAELFYEYTIEGDVLSVPDPELSNLTNRLFRVEDLTDDTVIDVQYYADRDLINNVTTLTWGEYKASRNPPPIDDPDDPVCEFCGQVCVHHTNRGRLQAFNADFDEGAEPKEYRFALYTEASRIFEGWLGAGNRKPINPCTVKWIKKKHPEPTGEYVGFQLSDQQLSTARDDANH